MSMTSAQIDELRAIADKDTVPYEASDAMYQAADTIWQLRCRLVDAEDRVRKSGELCKLCEREAESARMRELVVDMFAFLDGADCARFPAGDVVITQAQVGNFHDRMRELGVEVDG